MIKVSDGRSTTKQHKEELKKLGLSFKPTGKYSGYWYTNDDSKIRKLIKYGNKKGLKVEQENTKYSRSSTYREDFLRANKGYKKNGQDYHCAYCGRHIKKDKMEVDHVISVDAVKKSLISRIMMHLFFITNVNDTKNLVASCRRCNRKKSSKQGFWVIRGYLGKNIWFWRGLRLMIILAIISLFLIFSQ